jgi:glycosyltransferase involved in cell wall biosynthesis
MKTILFVSHAAELNGAERMLLETLRKIDHSRFRPLLAVPRSGPLVQAAGEAGVPARVIPMKWWLTERRKVWKQLPARVWNAAGVRRLAAWIREENAAAVFSNSAASFAGALAARKTHRPHVWLVHEVLDSPRPILRYLFGRRRLIRRIRRLSTVVAVNSLETARAFGGVPAVRLVPVGIDAARPSGDRDALRAELGIESEDKIVAVVGKIYPDKGQMEALRAVESLLPSQPRLKLLVIGDPADRRYAARLEKAAASETLRGRVVFTGFRNDLRNLFGLVDVLVVPSRVESFGRAALEAMVAGVPVLAVPEGGLKEFVIPGETGFLSDDATAAGLAAALSRILGDPDGARRIAARAAERTAAERSLAAQVEEIERILEDVLA